MLKGGVVLLSKHVVPDASSQRAQHAEGSFPFSHSPLGELCFPPGTFPMNIMHRNEKANSWLWTEGHTLLKVIC